MHNAPPPSPYAAQPHPEIKPFIDDNAAMRLLLPIKVAPLAMAAGYLGLFAMVLIPAPLALIVGIAAVMDLKRHPQKRGMGRAIFGLFMGAVGTAGLVFTLMK